MINAEGCPSHCVCVCVCVKVHFAPLSITYTGSSSPALPVNGAFVGASQHSKGILAGEGTQINPHSDECCKYHLTTENAKCSDGFWSWANLTLKDLLQLQGCDHRSRRSGREGSHSP